MNTAAEKLLEAQKFALRIRPKVGGFPYLAEALRGAGILQNTWILPACQSQYITKFGNVVTPGTPLITSPLEIPSFDQEALIKAIRVDQAGESSFPEFLQAAWKAGVISYTVYLEERKVTYFGIQGESYTESYPAVQVQ
jgi:uncharacterized protein YbcV (DUF1398 family)